MRIWLHPDPRRFLPFPLGNVEFFRHFLHPELSYRLPVVHVRVARPVNEGDYLFRVFLLFRIVFSMVVEPAQMVVAHIYLQIVESGLYILVVAREFRGFA